MIAIDTNVLVYAHRREADAHVAAAELIKSLAEGLDAWAIPWPCLYEFYAVVTNRRIWKDAVSTPEVAFRQVELWLGSPALRLIGENEATFGILRAVSGKRVTGGMIHDARIAAICLSHGVDELLSEDRDFSAFPKLRVRRVGA
jgi:toxin-antitoxin system PIN domain toxin